MAEHLPSRSPGPQDLKRRRGADVPQCLQPPRPTRHRATKSRRREVAYASPFLDELRDLSLDNVREVPILRAPEHERIATETTYRLAFGVRRPAVIPGLASDEDEKPALPVAQATSAPPVVTAASIDDPAPWGAFDPDELDDAAFRKFSWEPKPRAQTRGGADGSGRLPPLEPLPPTSGSPRPVGDMTDAHALRAQAAPSRAPRPLVLLARASSAAARAAAPTQLDHPAAPAVVVPRLVEAPASAAVPAPVRPTPAAARALHPLVARAPGAVTASLVDLIIRQAAAADVSISPGSVRRLSDALAKHMQFVHSDSALQRIHEMPHIWSWGEDSNLARRVFAVAGGLEVHCIAPGCSSDFLPQRGHDMVKHVKAVHPATYAEYLRADGSLDRDKLMRAGRAAVDVKLARLPAAPGATAPPACWKKAQSQAQETTNAIAWAVTAEGERWVDRVLADRTAASHPAPYFTREVARVALCDARRERSRAAAAGMVAAGVSVVR